MKNMKKGCSDAMPGNAAAFELDSCVEVHCHFICLILSFALSVI